MFQKLALLTSCAALLTACHSGHMYALDKTMQDGASASYTGTVLSVEPDGDFLMQTRDGLLFVDTDDVDYSAELGDQLHVQGAIDLDIGEAEAAELDAELIRSQQID